VALLADMIHNVGDAATAIPLGVAFAVARRPPSRRFTYGFGRVEDLAGLAVVLTILTSAVVAAYLVGRDHPARRDGTYRSPWARALRPTRRFSHPGALQVCPCSPSAARGAPTGRRIDSGAQASTSPEVMVRWDLRFALRS
jgi:hypothetical protein